MFLDFNPQNFVSSLKYMAQGMIGIVVVILIIICITALLNKFASKK